MGLVYRAYHAQLERFGAVKVLQGIASTPDAAARFRHEAQAIAQMRHQNIVNVYDFGEHDGTPYMIVEYVPGGNLASMMQQTPLDQVVALKYLRGIAAGLDYAHSLGIVHRDVKPGNVLLEKDGTAVLADFGLVKLLQGASIQSMTGVTTGTPAYMAPEQVTGHQVGPAADRYSLATMAYEMLTGVIPFDGDGVLELLYAHVHREPPAPSTRNAALNGGVDAVILRGLAKAPEARWETATAFVDALAAALAGGAPQPTAATVSLQPPVVTATKRLTQISAREATVAMAMPVASSSVPPTVSTAKRRRRRLEFVAGAVIVILLLVVAGICVAADLQPTMSVDPTIAVPGDIVTVIATRLPANQAGQIQLHSDEVFYFPFQTNNRGEVRQEIVIPSTLTTGVHQVFVCWGGPCPLEKGLRIVAPGTLPSPTPSSSPSPSSSGTPSPRRSPKPGSSPSANPSSRPTSNPTAGPSPKPKPSPSPSPTCPFSGPKLNESPDPVIAGTPVTVSGFNFKPGVVTLTYYAGNTGAGTSAGTATAGANCAFSKNVNTTFIGGSVISRTDRVQACDSANRCQSVTFKAVL